MTLVVSGLLNKQIAAELGVSEKTVKVHRGHVMKNASGVTGGARFAWPKEWASTPSQGLKD